MPAPQAAAPSTMPMVDPADAQAKALGYVTDATRVESAKFKSYVAGQACANCALFGGKAGDANGPCPVFAGKQVSAKGWCSAYSKKTG